jgi:HD-GYP domain-containing protein (c-di-GMP phosphodiesterase class II)
MSQDQIHLKQQHIQQLINEIIDIKQRHIEQLIEIGHSLTKEKNLDTLMEKIMLGAKDLSGADGGTLYMMTDDETHLKFTVVQTDSLKIKMGGTQGEITWPELPLYKESFFKKFEDGESPEKEKAKKNKRYQNREMVAAVCGLDGELINIDDVYEAEGFNFEGTKKFDAGTGYRTKSMLVVPMKNHEHEVIGVLQLLNKKDPEGNTIHFTEEDEKLILSMSSQAAVTIENTRLIKGLEDLLNAIIQSIATAIGEKSKYTGGHINRVAELSRMIADAIHEDNTIYKKVQYSSDEINQIETAAWLHDIGKIVTPEAVVDKSTKLETIYDRVHTVKAKFEILKRDTEIEYLKNKLLAKDDNEIRDLDEKFEKEMKELDDDMNFIVSSNTGGEFMADDKIERIVNISKKTLILDGKEEYLLNDNEIYNLSIRKGTLTNEEREIINNHVVVSYKMLKELPFPKKLRRVPVMAGSHHKKVKGGGYGHEDIIDKKMTLEDRILAVADVFEALTACDRPYKKGNSLNQSMRILSFMVKDGELDHDLVKFFVDKKLHLTYAKEYLTEEQTKDPITVDFTNI